MRTNEYNTDRVSADENDEMVDDEVGNIGPRKWPIINYNKNSILKLMKLLNSKRNLFISIEFCHNNSYEGYDDIINYIKGTLDIPLCIVDIISLYNCKHVIKYIKDIFLDFIKYIKDKKITKSVFVLPYIDHWALSLKGGGKDGFFFFKNSLKNGNESNETNNISENTSESESNNDISNKRRMHNIIYNANIQIYNLLFYMKNIIKKMNKKYCVKLISFQGTKDQFNSSITNLYDYKINIYEFVNIHILYYIHMNKEIHSLYMKNKLFIDDIYNIISNKLDFINSHYYSNIDMFKYIFKYYYNFYNNNLITQRSDDKRNRLDVIPKRENKTNKRDNNIYGSLSNHFNVLNFLMNISNFKYLKKYKYFLRKKKKRKYNIFISTNSDHNNVLNYICKMFYTSFYINEYIDTLLKRHTKITKHYSRKLDRLKNNQEKYKINQRPTIICGSSNAYAHDTTRNKYKEKWTSDNNQIDNNKDGLQNIKSNHRYKSVGNLKKAIDEKIYNFSRKKELSHIRKHFMVKQKYQNDTYNIYKIEENSYIKFYFSRFRIPNTFLIYGHSGAGKTTLLNFITKIICSDYKDIPFHDMLEYDTELDDNLSCENKENGVGTTIKKIYTEDSNTNTMKWDSSINPDIIFKYSTRIKNAFHGEKKHIFYEYQNVSIIQFENHLLINKTIGENSKYIKSIFLRALKNQPSVIIFDNIDLFIEKNNNYKYFEDDQNDDVYKNIYNLLIYYITSYINGSNRMKFIATSETHPKYFKFSFLNLIENILFIS
ncbi:conserved Plasmodium protein, unknown function [Plasmodium vinckei vinckei]|uniref:ATPase AAA-type core domain-containing protein n=1 Tax=Plasmodium vinckei vinckei TaxID=54757 RepID=A0A449BY28_PLAVN|nr:conserved Plasmodium protein, unknown function [Plasmodium vinckei vinckei]KEG04691.1 hypothetical protein YYE_00266 [Plasmodium vinckei vinckei]VEV58343.1 conserved Plasmodium protein, unknown function [Plasmodium vinckei vinckei]